MAAHLDFPGINLRNLKIRKFETTTLTMMYDYLVEWLQAIKDPHTDTNPGGGNPTAEKKVYGVIWGTDFDTTSTNIVVLVFYTE